MEHIELLRKMRDGLLDFLDDLRIILPEEQELIWFQIFVKNQVPMVDVMEYVIKNIVPLESKVNNRDDVYFKKHAVLFEGLGHFKKEVNHFKRLWEKDQNPEHREMVWVWLKYFIDLGKQFSPTQH